LVISPSIGAAKTVSGNTRARKARSFMMSFRVGRTEMTSDRWVDLDDIRVREELEPKSR